MARLVCTLVLASLACLTWQEESLMVVYPTNSGGSHTQLNLIEDNRSSLVQQKHMRSTLKPVYRTKSSSSVSVSTSYSVSSSESSRRIHIEEEPSQDLVTLRLEKKAQEKQELGKVAREQHQTSTEQYKERMRNFYNMRRPKSRGLAIPPTR